MRVPVIFSSGFQIENIEYKFLKTENYYVVINKRHINERYFEDL